MTILLSPENINNRLKNTQFIGGPADRAFFDDLINRIGSMAERHQRDVKRFMPDANEAGAWPKAFEIYQALKALDDAPPDPAAIAPGIARAARDAAWNRYINDREILIDLIRRDVITRQTCIYLGLVGDDLGPPTSDDPDAVRMNGGMRLDWRQVADRINLALGEWHSMTAADKAAIPQILAARRIEAANRELAKRMDALEIRDQSTAENAA